MNGGRGSVCFSGWRAGRGGGGNLSSVVSITIFNEILQIDFEH